MHIFLVHYSEFLDYKNILFKACFGVFFKTLKSQALLLYNIHK